MEVRGAHHLENAELGVERVENASDALQQPRRLRDLVLVQHGDDALEIMNDLKEPELVALVHDDENAFLGMRGNEFLRTQQFLELKVLDVVELHVF